MVRSTWLAAGILAGLVALVGCKHDKARNWEFKDDEVIRETEKPKSEGKAKPGPMKYGETVPDDPTYGKLPYKEDDPFVEIETTKGTMIAELYPGEAPKTVANFLKLVDTRYYDGLTFHRVIRDFMIQGGDNGEGGPGWTIDLEPSKIKHAGGTLSMARTNDPNSASAQFFICHRYSQSCKGLDGQYAAFGRLVYGMEVVDAIVAAADDLVGVDKERLPPDKAEKILSVTRMTWAEAKPIVESDAQPE